MLGLFSFARLLFPHTTYCPEISSMGERVMEEKTEEVSPIFIALIYTLMVSKLDSIKIEP